MSKELEALRTFGDVPYSTGNKANYSKSLEEVQEDYQTLLKALTPPTEEEVCKALEEYLNFTFTRVPKREKLSVIIDFLWEYHRGSIKQYHYDKCCNFISCTMLGVLIEFYSDNTIMNINMPYNEKNAWLFSLMVAGTIIEVDV